MTTYDHLNRGPDGAPSVIDTTEQPKEVFSIVGFVRNLVSKMTGSDHQHTTQPRLRHAASKASTGEFVEVEMGMVSGPNVRRVYDRGHLMSVPPAPTPGLGEIETLPPR